jgi:6-phosphogluconolactonase
MPRALSRQNTCADIHISPDGKYIYGSNRGHDSIAIFAVDSLSGELTFKDAIPSGGNTPRNFALTPDGRFVFVANQDSNNIVIFERDATTGLMNPTGVETQIPLPVCIKFLPDPAITYSD